jgi:alkaline phosphatase D
MLEYINLCKTKIMRNYLLAFKILLMNGVLMAQNEVQWVVSGALTPTSVDIRAKLTNPSSNVRAAVSTSNPPAPPFIYSNVGVADASNNLNAALKVTGLQPNTKYYYQIEADGVADNSSDDIGIFETPKYGPYSFTFVTGVCNNRKETTTYQDFLNYNALFYLNLGDLHYADPCDQQISFHREPYETRVFNQPYQREVFRQMAFAYMWDDHDYCGNDDNGDQLPGTANARIAYQEYIPHYPLAAGSGNVPIYQSFEIGRVKFILTDLRSARIEGVTTMGAAQKQWFKNEILDAKRRGLLICWASSYSWYGILTDNWGGFAAERTELSEFFRDSLIESMFFLNGDAHMLAIDNGDNGDFTTTKNLPFRYPLIQAGPIDGSCSWKGGTYSEGAFYQWGQRRQQYGVVSIKDNGGDSIRITMEGYRKDPTTGATTQLVSYTFSRRLGNYISSIHQTDDIKFELYPNPSNGIFYFRNLQEERSFIQVLSSEGKLLLEIESDNTQFLPIDLSVQPSGIYWVKVTTPRSHTVKKVLVNK